MDTDFALQSYSSFAMQSHDCQERLSLECISVIMRTHRGTRPFKCSSYHAMASFCACGRAGP
jgi:hypothetical protein